MYDVFMRICWPMNMLNVRSKDMIMKVNDVKLLCLTHSDYDMLISQMKVVMKGNSNPKLKSICSCLYEKLFSYGLRYVL